MDFVKLQCFSGESWLGLEALHQLTYERDYSLRITLIDFDKKTYVAVYEKFKVMMMMRITMGILVKEPRQSLSGMSW